MGFGIAVIGYAFLLLDQAGGATVGALLIGYGLFSASRLEKNFLMASLSALFIMPRGIVNLLSTVGVIDLDQSGAVNASTYIIYLVAWTLLNYFWLTGVKRIAKDNGAQKLFGQAHWRLVMSLTFSLLSAVILVWQVLGTLPAFVLSAQAVANTLVTVVNAFFMHTCFILITSEKQYERDKQELAIHNAKALEKQLKDKEKEERYAKKYKKRR